MNPIAIFFIALVCMFGGMLLGMSLRTRLPEHHVSADSRDMMKLGIGMITTLSALVLSLLISSAKGTFDSINRELRQTGSKIILLDRSLALYGPETGDIRDTLRRTVADTIVRIWPEEENRMAVEKAGQSKSVHRDIDQKLRQLSPQNDVQRQLQALALQINGEIVASRWLLAEYIGQSSFPMPILVLLVCWLTIVFFTIGLFSSRNTTIIAVLFACAFAAASSLFLILDLDQLFGGLIKISSASLLNVLAHLGQ